MVIQSNIPVIQTDAPFPSPVIVTDDHLVSLAVSLGWQGATVTLLEKENYCLLSIEGTLDGRHVKRAVENVTAGYTDSMHGWLADMLRGSTASQHV